jgi:hypothetical protein
MNEVENFLAWTLQSQSEMSVKCALLIKKQKEAAMNKIVALLIALSMSVAICGMAIAGEHRERPEGIHQKSAPGEIDHDYISAYIGLQQNLVQITKGWSVQGIADFYPQQNGNPDEVLVGLRITNGKPLFSFVKEQ